MSYTKLLNDMVEYAAEQSDVSIRDIYNQSRYPEHVQPRQAVMQAAYKMKIPILVIARHMKRDQRTVRHAFETKRTIPLATELMKQFKNR